MIFGAIHVYWFVVPLVAVISLVYSATRHESWPRIWRHAIRLFTWILGLLVAAMVILLAINTQV